MFDQWDAFYILQEDEQYQDYMREMDELLLGDSEDDFGGGGQIVT